MFAGQKPRDAMRLLEVPHWVEKTVIHQFMSEDSKYPAIKMVDHAKRSCISVNGNIV